MMSHSLRLNHFLPQFELFEIILFQNKPEVRLSVHAYKLATSKRSWTWTWNASAGLAKFKAKPPFFHENILILLFLGPYSQVMCRALGICICHIKNTNTAARRFIFTQKRSIYFGSLNGNRKRTIRLSNHNQPIQCLCHIIWAAVHNLRYQVQKCNVWQHYTSRYAHEVKKLLRCLLASIGRAARLNDTKAV